ncbi:adenosylcobinamide-phosphate synthase CbiB [Acuticoccus yangtzensis]|uniref:adenosylcobinamide-phosphate synthase CbiB n=1 Tax=Acuticoccus yangtzensis TaxID=1443441 RepID=UPI0009496227|nr:adenosylcobinamide-phosphate synthase CbiB [Acuticoccus yangtzensis]
MTAFAVPLALAADMLVGEPAALWRRTGHPITWIGALISRLDARLNNGTRARGVLALAALSAVCFFAGGLIEALLPGGPVGVLLTAAVASIFIAHKSLIEHVSAVAAAPDLATARARVGLIVGRDTAEMDAGAVSRAALESLGENFSDGVVAPVFWFAVLGLPGLILYKGINTADSMIGHKTPRHKAFGWAAARTDDAANYVPARLAAVLIALQRPHVWRRWSAVAASARRHVSPNAGWPEAALAVALKVELGGPRRYQGRMLDGVRLNRGGRTARLDDIARGTALIGRAGLTQIGLYTVLAVLSAL